MHHIWFSDINVNHPATPSMNYDINTITLTSHLHVYDQRIIVDSCSTLQRLSTNLPSSLKVLLPVSLMSFNSPQRMDLLMALVLVFHYYLVLMVLFSRILTLLLLTICVQRMFFQNSFLLFESSTFRVHLPIFTLLAFDFFSGFTFASFPIYISLKFILLLYLIVSV